MPTVGVVTAFVPLPVRHLSAEQYHAYGDALVRAATVADATVYLHTHPLAECWLMAENPPLVVPNPVPTDRYENAEVNAHSNIVQHNRTTWALQAAEKAPEVDVWVWLDYAVLKQGGWRNNPVTEAAITRFLRRVATTPSFLLDATIPFPGIAPQAPVEPTGNNWRFCGSTHIWPKKFLPAIDAAYKHELRLWIAKHGTTPLDLPIWALVEQNHPELPFQFYPANHCAEQLDHYPFGKV